MPEFSYCFSVGLFFFFKSSNKVCFDSFSFIFHCFCGETGSWSYLLHQFHWVTAVIVLLICLPWKCMGVLAIHSYMFSEMPIQVFCIFYLDLKISNVVTLTYITWKQVLYQINDMQIFSPSLCVNSISWTLKVFNFDYVQFIKTNSFMDCAFGVISKKSLATPNHKDFLFFFSRSVIVSVFMFRSMGSIWTTFFFVWYR